jgi:hypothetical protein
MKAGRKRWLEKMRLAKELGLIDRIPGGWTAGLPRSGDRQVAKALLMLAELRRQLSPERES